MRKPKIICSDFDGTLRCEDPDITQQNLCAVQQWRQAGNIFIVVTGRNHAVLDQIFPNWQNLIDYIIMDNGGVIFSNHDEAIRIHELPRHFVRQIQGLVCNDATTLSYSPYRHDFELLLSETVIKLRLWFRTEHCFIIYQQHIESQGWPVKVLPWIGAGFSKLPDGTSTDQFFGFLDIVPADSGKECAIAELVNLANWLVGPEEIITIGDDYNDIAMLEAYHGYAIDGSPQGVIAATQGNTTPDVATLIYRHL